VWIVYSCLAGFEAVVWTDAIQGIVLITGPFGLSGSNIWTNFLWSPSGKCLNCALEADKFGLGSFKLDFTTLHTFGWFWVYGLFIPLQNFGVDQKLMSTFTISAKQSEIGKNSTLAWKHAFNIPHFLFFFSWSALRFGLFISSNPNLSLPKIAAKVRSSGFPYFICEPIARWNWPFTDCGDLCCQDE